MSITRILEAQKKWRICLHLEYWRDEGWYVGKLKEIPGVFSQGETLAELEENVEEARELLERAGVKP